MNWLSNMLPWYQWLIFGLVPPLIFLLYFLKLRRVPVEVPSTYLWARTVEDLHVNSIWQRLRKNILLLLQMLAILLLALSCLNPGCEGTQLVGERFIFVIDRSASMSATDTENGSTRLEEAKRQMKIAIDQMKSGDAAMIISFCNDANVEQSYTTSKAKLKQKVDSIQQSQRPSDLQEALVAASGLANPGRTSDKESEIDVQVAEALAAKMIIYTDGAVRRIPEFRMGNLSAEYRPIGTPLGRPANVGITAFSINDQLEDSGQVEVFARVYNAGLEEASVGLSLFVDGELTDARRITIDGINSTSLNFDLTAAAVNLESSIPVELRIDDADVYLQDNRATTVLNPPRMINLLVVSDDPSFLQLALTTDRLKKFAIAEFQPRSFLESDTYRNQSIIGTYDLIIFDRCQPEVMPPCSTVFWGTLPEEGWSVQQTIEVAPIVDVNTAHPISFDLKMGNVNILEAAVLKGPPGSTPLITSTAGPIMMVGPRASFEDLVIGFPITAADDNGNSSINTDWPKNLSFPFFIQNMVLELGGGSQFGISRNFEPGELIRVKPRLPYPAVEITLPNGKEETVAAGADKRIVFGDTETCGVYRVQGQDANEVDHLFTVNLLDQLESDLEVREKLDLGLEEVEGSRSSEQVRMDGWTWLVLLGLVILMVEWYIYNKRVFI